MTEQSSDSNLKEQDYRKWVEGQSTEALEKELRTLELRRMLLQKKDPEEEARLEQHEGQEEWEALSPEEQAEADRNTFELLEKPESLEAEEAFMKLMEDPEKLAQLEVERQAQLAAMKPEERAALQGEITPWITEQLEVAQQLEAVQRELAARRIHELSKGEAASALAEAQELPKRSTERLLYRSKIKYAILVQLTKNPDASDFEICFGIDRSGTVQLPASWKKNPNDYFFREVYMDRGRRHKVETTISKVRADMRKQGLLPPR